MDTNSAVSDLERRKKVRVRLRKDLSVTPQKYEGRTYFIVKDPVSLRYYRFKEQERFLLDLMDGKSTLDDAQKAFEQRFRPERLTLEDLEAFASQLLQAGLAQNETPNAGKQLFDRFKKQRKNKISQAFLNILYIKIPIFDPDRLLERMVRPLRFIYTTWFLVLSIAIMLSAIGLVATHWNSFLSKLPSYHEFFTFETIIYMWVALGAVKIIHEFGHGLSCKTFGGEVHEMGFLLLVFSPCLYANVSDSWTLPSKWKRIIIGAAGIYVELIIASFATFLWWTTDPGTFFNKLCMGLMVVCSVSTVIFNANPLMKFDGYYILADWMEIPNLRDRANRFLQNLAMQYGLGMETQPEPYMTRTRQGFFVAYAVISWIYRWVVTFGVLYFMYTFLKPYKLGALSFLIGTGAVVSMIGYPIYRMFKAVRRRGRIPDMKSGRVAICAAACVALLVLILAVPIPSSWLWIGLSVRAEGVIQVDSRQVQKIVVPETGGMLKELRVQDGQRVRAGDELAKLANPDLEVKILATQMEEESRERQCAELRQQQVKAGARSERVVQELAVAEKEREAMKKALNSYREQERRLTLRAEREGIVMKLVKKEDTGRLLEKGTVICEVGNDQALQAVLLVPPSDLKLVEPHSRAWIRVHGRGYNFWPGTVHDISSAEAKEIPPQLSNKAGGDVPTQQDPETRSEKPQSQHYLVAVSFDQIDDAIQPGSMCRIRIEGKSRTLWWRFRRYLTNTFNWGL